jgi:hypothetical protein
MIQFPKASKRGFETERFWNNAKALALINNAGAGRTGERGGGGGRSGQDVHDWNPKSSLGNKKEHSVKERLLRNAAK